jgi:hypothetical protein
MYRGAATRRQGWLQGKIAEEWSQGRGLAELTQQRFEPEIRERVEQELRVARRIQQAALPTAFVIMIELGCRIRNASRNRWQLDP